MGENAGEQIQLIADPLGHRDVARAMKVLSDCLAEERAIDTGLHSDSRPCRASAAHTRTDEGIGSIGVVDIPGAVVYVEDLVGLRHGAEQRII